MSHEINKNDTFAFTGSRTNIWHGLGNEIEEGLSAEQAFVDQGLGWRTVLEPVYRKHLLVDDAGFPLMAEDGSQASKMIEVEGHRYHSRQDIDLGLGMVSDGYKPVENIDLARFADALAGADAAVNVSTCGSLYNCRRIFVLVKLPQVVRATKDDVSEQYVLIGNGHGGFASLSVYPTSIRVVCANTLRWSERDMGRGLSFRHTGDMDAKIAAAKVVLGTAVKETEKFQEAVTALVSTSLSVEQAKHFMEQAWEGAYGKIGRLEGEALAKMTAKRDEQVREFLGLMENERNSMPGIAGTAWAALNAFTEFQDHGRGRFKAVAESEARAHSNLFGSSSQAKTRAFRAALALV